MSGCLLPLESLQMLSLESPSALRSLLLLTTTDRCSAPTGQGDDLLSSYVTDI